MDEKTAKEQEQGYIEQRKVIKVSVKKTLPCGKELEILRASDFGGSSNTDQPYLILIFPGGGYEFTSFRESLNIAKAFAQNGVDAAVLHYSTENGKTILSTGKGLMYTPLKQAAEAFATLHTDTSLGFTKHKIVVCGFSAGAHLAASLCNLYKLEQIQPQDPSLQCCLRPDGAVLGYGVFEIQKIGHTSDLVFENLSGSINAKEWAPFTQTDKVSADTPPSFLWHTADDAVVPVYNSLNYAQAIWQHGGIAELTIYPKGIHGLATATADVEPDNTFKYADPHVAVWVKQAVDFMKKYV